MIGLQLRIAAAAVVGAAAAIAYWLAGYEDAPASPPDGGTPIEQRNVA